VVFLSIGRVFVVPVLLSICPGGRCRSTGLGLGMLTGLEAGELVITE